MGIRREGIRGRGIIEEGNKGRKDGSPLMSDRPLAQYEWK